MEWKNDANNHVYGGYQIFLSSVRPTDGSFRVAYSIFSTEGWLMALGSSVGDTEDAAFLLARETAHDFVDALPLRSPKKSTF